MSTSTQPFSLTAEHNRNGANGFTRYESVSEFVDNSLDANAPGHTMAAICEEGSSKGYHIGYDLGDGAQTLLSLYGIGTAVCKKRGATRGLKNYGHGAAVGRFNPDRVVHITRHRTASRASTLIYNTGALYRAIDAAKRTGDCDFRQIDAELNPFSPTNGGLTDEIRELLLRMQSLITSKPVYDSLAKVLANILTNEQPTFHLMIMEYEVFPTEMIAEIKDALCAFRRDYYPALVAGRFVEYLTAGGSSRADASNAVDHMGPPECARLAGKIELRSDAATATDYLRFTVATYGTGVASAEFWLSCKDGDKLFYDGRAGPGPFTTAPPAGWEIALPVGDDAGISFMCSVLSHKEELEQTKAIGSKTLGTNEAAGVNEMRGVQLCYQDHNLGLPLYNEAQWEDKRNVGGLRIQLGTSNPDIAERFFGIKTKKHSANFDGMHPLMRRFLNWTMKLVIIKRYSHYENNKTGKRGEARGVSDWKFSYFCALMLNAKAADPTSVKPTTAPRLPASAAISCASSVASSHSSDYTSDAESESFIKHIPAASALSVTTVTTTSRYMPISPRQLASELLRATTRLDASNLAELAETASSVVVPGLVGKLGIFLDLIKSLETVGLKYSESD